LGEDITQSKPAVQQAARDLYAVALGTLLLNQQKLNYVNFYADLQMLVDQQIVCIMDELDAQGLTDNTIVIRVSDHGEMGLSHGGLRQKMFNAYEETIHVPMVISNPQLFPTPLETDALAALVDVVPTVAALAHVPNPDRWNFRGRDLSPIVQNPTARVQNDVLFTFDDDRAGTGSNIPTINACPHHVRAIRSDDADGQWKFAHYFNPAEEGAIEPEYEMYHLRDAAGDLVDPNETDNLAHPSNPRYAQMSARRQELMQRLEAVEAERLGYQVFLPVVKR
jgi:arylsulfatase A-like enzyme